MRPKPAWQALLAGPEELVLPWLGGRVVHGRERSFAIDGAPPPEHGWWRFRVGGGRKAALVAGPDAAPETAPLGVEDGARQVRGTLVGDRLVPDGARVAVDPDRLAAETRRVHLVEPGLARFARALTIEDRDGALVFVREELPLGPEPEVEAAWQDRRPSIDHVRGVTPALDLAFRWLSRQRARAEARREAARLEAERDAQRAAVQSAIGTGADRRQLAAWDFDAAAREALRIAGAELLDTRPAHARGEVVVTYRFRGLRLECVVTRATLRIVDAGVCLADHETGERGDALFTLESLPAVIGQALDEDVLVVFRHGD